MLQHKFAASRGIPFNSPSESDDLKDNQPRFAFWYETWKPGTWQLLQPANVVIGVPATAVPEIHENRGKALNYVTLYQATFGSTFLRDSQDLPEVGFHTQQGFLPSAFGGANNYVLCANSLEVRSRALRYTEQGLIRDHFDGFFVDNTYLPPAATVACDAKHPHATPEQIGGVAYIELLRAVRDSLKKTKSDALVVTNPGNPGAFTYQSQGTTLWDLSDYVLWESYGYSSLAGKEHDRLTGTIAASYELSQSTQANKIIALSYPTSYAEALCSYAIATVFGFKYAADLGVSDTGRQVGGGHYGTFLSMLPTMSGLPLDAAPASSVPILKRSYRNGCVVVNLGTSPYRLKNPRSSLVFERSGRARVEQGEQVQVASDSAIVLTYGER
jgi:hypothetical protein